MKSMNTMAEISPSDIEQALAVAKEAVRQAGDLLRKLYAAPLEVVSEAAHDIKLKADQIAEAQILKCLEKGFPLPVLTEESGEHGHLEETSMMWVVDPLDGTFNFSRGMPMCCSSVGLWRGGEPVLGAVYDFFADELFFGVVGGEARRNDTVIHPSSVTTIEQAALATGFPHHRDLGDESMSRFLAQVRGFKKIRMLGSAALMGAYTGCGWLDAYIEDDIWLWDVAGAAAVARAAGCKVQVRPGTAGRWARIVKFAATPELFTAIED